MAPVRPSGGKPATSKGAGSGGSKGKPSGGSSSKSTTKRPPPKEMKAKPRSAPELQKKRKRRVYTEKELNLPALNTITPVGVQKPRGKKKGKVFVDDLVCGLSGVRSGWDKGNYVSLGLVKHLLIYLRV